MNVHEFAELAAGHALNALSPDDERAFQAALAEHPEWAGIAEADAATAARLAETADEVEPPAALRSALLARIGSDGGSLPAPVPTASGEALPGEALLVEAAEPTPPAEPEPSAGPSSAPAAAPNTEAIQTVARRRWTRGLLALAASFVLLIALGTTAVVIGDRLRAPAEVVALDEIEAASDARSATVDIEDGGTATAHWSESLGKAVLVTTDLPPTGGDETYQLWFVREDGAVSAGLFETDRDGVSTTILDGEVVTGDVIAVTIEPDGGSPTGQPTSDPLFTIPTA